MDEIVCVEQAIISMILTLLSKKKKKKKKKKETKINTRNIFDDSVIVLIWISVTPPAR
jgi:hypothetical protein